MAWRRYRSRFGRSGAGPGIEPALARGRRSGAAVLHPTIRDDDVHVYEGDEPQPADGRRASPCSERNPTTPSSRSNGPLPAHPTLSHFWIR